MEPSSERLNEIPGGYFTFTDAGTVLLVNRPLLEQLGYQPSEVVGESVERLLTMASRIFYQTHFFPLLKLQGKVDEIFLSLRTKEGQSVPVLLNASTLQQAQSRVHQCLCLPVWQRQKYEEQILQAKQVAERALEENSALLQAKQALEHYQQVLDHQLTELQNKNQELLHFSKLFTHDLQEPLRKITLLADVLQHQGSPNLTPEGNKLLNRITLASRSLRELIHRLQEYILLDVAPQRMSPVHLNSILKEAHQRIGQRWPMADIHLNTIDLPPIEGNRSQLVELFAQLMDNSVKFHPPPRQAPVEITISGHLIEHNRFRAIPGKYQYTEFVRLTYTDNGVGIKPELAGKIFQIHKKPQADGMGLGFGLAICKKIIDHHGGSIEINTRHPQGAQFVILLPVRQSIPPR